jgi:hypothetical protein
MLITNSSLAIVLQLSRDQDRAAFREIVQDVT